MRRLQRLCLALGWLPLIFTLLVGGVLLAIEPPAWAASVPVLSNQTVPPFVEHLILPLIYKQPHISRLTRWRETDFRPIWQLGLTWSPDSSKVVFAASRPITGTEYRTDLFVVNADGSIVTQLTGKTPPMRPSPHSPAWSPDGSEIAFVYSICSPCEGHGVWFDYVYLIGADGEDQREIGGGINPMWSPDGSKILYQHSQSYYANPPGPLSIISLSGDPNVELGIAGESAQWSPDSTKITFVCLYCESGNGQIWVINADGSNLANLNTDTYSYLPTWSPDSKQIAFVAYQEGRRELRIIDANGENPVTLSDIQWQVLGNLTWLPDGQHLLFFGQDSTSQQTSLYVIGREGQGLRRLFAHPSNVAIYNPIWSPDRTKFAFEDNDDIYILKVFAQ